MSGMVQCALASLPFCVGTERIEQLRGSRRLDLVRGRDQMGHRLGRMNHPFHVEA
jgi:hypothetical protein